MCERAGASGRGRLFALGGTGGCDGGDGRVADDALAPLGALKCEGSLWSSDL